MNEFKSLDELKLAFLKGNVQFPADIIVNGVKFHIRDSSRFTFEDMIANNHKGALIYSAGRQNKDAAVKAGLNEWILFIWGLTKKKGLLPTHVQTTTSHRAASVLPVGSVTERMKMPGDDNLIGDLVNVSFSSFPGTRPVKGKVDTGAEISSLHVDNWKVNGNKVTFLSSVLSPNEISLNLHNHQAVKSVNGVEYRPVISLSIRINNRLLKDVLFNLTNRSSMDYPVLVGQNALEKGKFLIDPSMKESVELSNVDTVWDGSESISSDVDWDSINTIINDCLNESVVGYDSKQLQAIYDVLKEHHNVSFADFIKFIHTEAARQNDLEY